MKNRVLASSPSSPIQPRSLFAFLVVMSVFFSMSQSKMEKYSPQKSQWIHECDSVVSNRRLGVVPQDSLSPNDSIDLCVNKVEIQAHIYNTIITSLLKQPSKIGDAFRQKYRHNLQQELRYDKLGFNSNI